MGQCSSGNVKKQVYNRKSRIYLEKLKCKINTDKFVAILIDELNFRLVIKSGLSGVKDTKSLLITYFL